MLKQWLQASQAQLRTYEWVETTVITKGGEEKSRKQNTVYYGADGKLQKVPVAGGSEGKSGGPPGRLMKKAAENKKEEMVDYMEQAAALMHSYMPPDPNRIQQAVNNGKLSVTPGQRVRLDFRDYLKSGDLLSVEIEAPTNRLIGMAVYQLSGYPEGRGPDEHRYGRAARRDPVYGPDNARRGCQRSRRNHREHRPPPQGGVIRRRPEEQT